jgi:formylmethanofuran dehydrogenase subunit B
LNYKMSKQTIVKDVVCPFCGCLCDDIEVYVDLKENKIVETANACVLGTAKFMSANDVSHRITTPMIRENGKLKEVSIDDAIEKAAQILVDAEWPLLYGWASTECEAQSVGVELTEEVGGVIDQTASVCHGPSILGVQDIGLSGATLGEIMNRADLIIYWGCNPVHAHPRHMSRYSVYRRGFFTERGVKDRLMVVVDPRETHTAKLANLFIQPKPGTDFELISAIRTVLAGDELAVDEVGGVTKEEITDLVNILKNSKLGIVFFGLGLTMSPGKHRNIDIALSLIRDLAAFTKFLICPMRGHWNVTGIGQVLAWQTGYPFAVDFSRGYPRYGPGEFTSNEVLTRGEVDAALVIAADAVANFPLQAAKRLAEIPLIAIDPHQTPTTELADVLLPCSIAGIEAEGTGYRMDGVPIRVKQVMEAPEGCLSDKEILERLLAKVRELKAKKN